ncbi:hypothetical protein [Saccharomonospora iraqiensis]|uniref:hypothetical protein n=1 Tax=Saccharomonospora iraqiensis TaxID=52698 RepID=UPI001F1D6617|nr:hypothetical protein [Saccharomonospora iraqiensis]
MTTTANNGPISNEGDAPLTITDVSTVGSRGMSILEAVLVPRNGPPNGAEYPPEPDVARPTWGQRVPAEGATIEPGETWWFVIGLRAETRRAEVERFRVDYRDPDGTPYRARTGMSWFHLPDCHDPWPDT